MRLLYCLLIVFLVGCGGSGGSSSDADPITPDPAPDPTPDPEPGPLDETLGTLITRAGLSGDAAFNRILPDIADPLPQLGKKLFFSKSLGGEFDSACVSCHHPALGGGDNLTLPVGVGATSPDLLGPGRVDGNLIPDVPRHSPTVFNVGLWDSGLFWDSRVESFGKEAFANGSVSDIRTPDVAFGLADPDAGPNLPAAQARFPVTSAEEMRSNFLTGETNAALREHLAARIGNYGAGQGELLSNDWLAEFQSAFASTADAETLITFDNIALALAEFQRSMVFTSNPFAEYVNGDLDALTNQQKEGAILFFQTVDEGGGGCANCHSGDRFTDELHHVIAFPQIGPGKGDGTDDDFGRARETGDDNERYHFRTPSLLNIAVTAPYGHAGAYESLDQVLQHYDNPGDETEDFFDDGGVCQLSQFEDVPDCENLYPAAEANTELALQKLAEERNSGDSLFENPNLNGNERADIVAFLESLTDPCTVDRDCLAPWIPTRDEAPDENQLNAVDAGGADL